MCLGNIWYSMQFPAWRLDSHGLVASGGKNSV
jgi:hypothetical protein